MLSKRMQCFSWPLMVLMLFGTTTIATAQDQSEEPEGQIIQIGPDRNKPSDQNARRGGRRMFQPGFPEEPPRQAPTYWVGLVGGPVTPAVRHHVDLPEGIGLEVMDIVPDGPAAEAGLQKYDIMVRAGDVQLDEMQDLVELVATEGERQGQIAIEVVRGLNTETVWVTPTKRPADAGFSRPGPRGDFGGGFGGLDNLQGLQGMLQGLQGRFGDNQDGRGFGFRHLGPGMFLNQQQMSMQQLPDGTSVKVEKRDNQPTKITVERGDEAWEIEGDNPDALDQLPDDVRPYVEQMLGQSQPLPGGNFTAPNFGRQPFPAQMPQAEGLNERLQQMEQQMRELQKQLTAPPQQGDQVQ